MGDAPPRRQAASTPAPDCGFRLWLITVKRVAGTSVATDGPVPVSGHRVPGAPGADPASANSIGAAHEFREEA